MSKELNTEQSPSEENINNLFKSYAPSPSKNFHRKMDAAPWMKNQVTWKYKSLRIAFSLGIFAVILLFSPNIYSYATATNTPTPSQTPTASRTAEISFIQTIQPALNINEIVVSTRTPQQ